jgi:hypothetical protein
MQQGSRAVRRSDCYPITTSTRTRSNDVPNARSLHGTRIEHAFTTWPPVGGHPGRERPSAGRNFAPRQVAQAEGIRIRSDGPRRFLPKIGRRARPHICYSRDVPDCAHHARRKAELRCAYRGSEIIISVTLPSESSGRNRCGSLRGVSSGSATRQENFLRALTLSRHIGRTAVPNCWHGRSLDQTGESNQLIATESADVIGAEGQRRGVLCHM